MAATATATASSDRIVLALVQLIRWAKEAERVHTKNGGEGDALPVGAGHLGRPGLCGDPGALCVADLPVLVETATPQTSSR